MRLNTKKLLRLNTKASYAAQYKEQAKTCSKTNVEFLQYIPIFLLLLTRAKSQVDQKIKLLHTYLRLSPSTSPKINNELLPSAAAAAASAGALHRRCHCCCCWYCSFHCSCCVAVMLLLMCCDTFFSVLTEILYGRTELFDSKTKLVHNSKGHTNYGCS